MCIKGNIKIEEDDKLKSRFSYLLFTKRLE